MDEPRLIAHHGPNFARASSRASTQKSAAMRSTSAETMPRTAINQCWNKSAQHRSFETIMRPGKGFASDLPNDCARVSISREIIAAAIRSDANAALGGSVDSGCHST